MVDKKKTLVVKANKPPVTVKQSIQYDLFSQFVSNDDQKVSNTVEVWESIPKYFFTPAQVKKLRTADGLAGSYTWKYSYNNGSYAIKIQPALITIDGVEKAYFPGVTEELVEEALKKILADQRYGLHDESNVETWVRFTLSMVKKELKLRNKTRSITEIKHAIAVLSSCVLTLYKEEKEVWKGSVLQDLVTVGREEYIEDPSSYHLARLPVFISTAINKLETRQYNYDRLMKCKNSLARWIYKRLINRFTQASFTTTYHFMFSSIAADSGLLQNKRPSDNRSKVLAALDELVKSEVLSSYENFPDENKKTGEINDVKYEVKAARAFIAEQKAANKRRTENNKLGIK